MIFNPETGENTYIFHEDNKKTITTMLFEIDYDSTAKRIALNGDMYYSDYMYFASDFIVNNYQIKKDQQKIKLSFF